MEPTNGKGHDNWAARWSADRIEWLKELWAANLLSCAQIASRMGLTRNAVIGKVHRLRLTPKKLPRLKQPNRGGRPRRAIIAKPVPVPPIVSTDESVPEFLCLMLEELDASQCHYPHGDQVPFSFCGQPTDGTSFCAYHHRMCFYQLSPGRRNLDSKLVSWQGVR